jgi:uncharacterized protein (TIGR02145 family)
MSAFSRQLLMILGATVLAVGLIAIMVGLGDDSGADRVSSAKTVKKMMKNMDASDDDGRSSAASAKSSKPGSFTDSRDGKKYRSVKIGGLMWMAENINYQPQTGKSWCYDNKESNCNQYGRLYDWNTAMTVCPRGWHLPSSQEWDDLIKAVGGDSAGEKLKAASGWNNGNGTDEYGFSALPGGLRFFDDGSFDGAGNYGYWWTATARGSGRAYYRSMHSDYGYVDEYYGAVVNGFSVRCVGD